MPATVRLPRITKLPDGSIVARFGKRERHFGSIDHVRAVVADVLGPEAMEALALREMLERRPDLENLGPLEGRVMTIDTSKAIAGA